MKCPYCNSKDVVIYEVEIETNISTFMCYNCKRSFEERDIKGCGKQIFKYGDNYPVFNKGEDKMKEFERGNKVRVKTDTGIYYEGEIIGINFNNNIKLYRVKYFAGYKDMEDMFKGEELELLPTLSNNTIKTNCSTIRGQMSHKTSRIKFEKMGKVPKAKKDDLVDLWIDLWEFLRNKIKEIKK